MAHGIVRKDAEVGLRDRKELEKPDSRESAKISTGKLI